jgi:hypothetical protein
MDGWAMPWHNRSANIRISPRMGLEVQAYAKIQNIPQLW